MKDLFLIVVDRQSKTSEVWDAFLKRLFIQFFIIAVILSAVEDVGDLALVPAHSQKLHCELLTQLFQRQVLRLNGNNEFWERDVNQN